eukprot:GHVS01088249.1.p1 GENE.GHVS01088249.1~~GHVS01088249.1.p1  ORF type:complete len:411 (-),score=54.57 GHVS01088249.1:175-1407(-)
MPATSGVFLDPPSLPDWQPAKDRREGTGPLEFVFEQTFSFQEKLLSSIDGLPMGEDAHSDARQSLLHIAKMVDAGTTTRAIIQTKDETVAMIVDIVMEDSKVAIKQLPNSGDPMVMVRVGQHSGNPTKRTLKTKKLALELSRTIPPLGVADILCCSDDEMRYLKEHFDRNNARLKQEFCKKFEASLPRHATIQAPGMFTSFLSPLYKQTPPKQPKQVCLVCGGVGRLVCAQCKVARYCGRECQTQHWRAGHKTDCRSPEELAMVGGGGEGDAWVDVDPKKSMDEMGWLSAVSITQSVGASKLPKPTNVRDVFDGIPIDHLLVVKVQIEPGSMASGGSPILIYPRGKKFQLMARPKNTGEESYNRLHRLVQQQGVDVGGGWGRCKAYLKAYVRGNGKLRIMLDYVGPAELW